MDKPKDDKDHHDLLRWDDEGPIPVNKEKEELEDADRELEELTKKNGNTFLIVVDNTR